MFLIGPIDAHKSDDGLGRRLTGELFHSVGLGGKLSLVAARLGPNRNPYGRDVGLLAPRQHLSILLLAEAMRPVREFSADSFPEQGNDS